jgi:hypothetical protein
MVISSNEIGGTVSIFEISPLDYPAEINPSSFSSKKKRG